MHADKVKRSQPPPKLSAYCTTKKYDSENFRFSPFFPTLTPYIHVFLNKSLYFFPKLPKTHIFAPAPWPGGQNKKYTPLHSCNIR